jgi:hypothetical protein
MTINARILITALFLIGLTPLWAQNQRLTWTGDEYAMRYEVVIEREEAGEYHNVLREFTGESFIEISLPSGKYRCQVIPYDFLNQPVPVTEWMDFEILSGNHEIAVVNEIPLTGTVSERIIEYQNRVDFYLSAAGILHLPYYGESSAILPYGAAMRFGVVSAKQRLFNPGMELTASWRAQTLLFDGDMIQQTRFTNGSAALRFRLGVGVSLSSDDDSWWAAGQYSTHFNVGASLLCLLPKNFFMETGIVYSQLFTQDFDCFFRSWIGFGCRF